MRLIRASAAGRAVAIGVVLSVFAVAGLADRNVRNASAAVNCDVADLTIDGEEQQFLSLINNYRAANGLGALTISVNINRAASWMAADMANYNYFSHNDRLGRTFDQRMSQCDVWPSTMGENITAGTTRDTAQEAFDAWRASPGHNANMLNGSWRQMGIARYYNGSSTYSWYWVNDFSSANDGTNALTPPTAFNRETAGVFLNGMWHLRNSNSSGPAQFIFADGTAGMLPVSGDWDGNGTQTPGLFYNGMWYLWNSLQTKPPDLSFAFGSAGMLPIAGDWNGDGRDTIGVFVNGAWHLRNTNSTGPANLIFSYGVAGMTPVVGDWDGNGTDTVGVFLNGYWHLRNSNSAGPAQIIFNYGTGVMRPVTGDWDGNGADSIGMFYNGRWHLRNTNSTGPADVVFVFGQAGMLPVPGNWDGQ